MKITWKEVQAVLRAMARLALEDGDVDHGEHYSRLAGSVQQCERIDEASKGPP